MNHCKDDGQRIIIFHWSVAVFLFGGVVLPLIGILHALGRVVKLLEALIG